MNCFERLIKVALLLDLLEETTKRDARGDSANAYTVFIALDDFYLQRKEVLRGSSTGPCDYFNQV